MAKVTGLPPDIRYLNCVYEITSILTAHHNRWLPWQNRELKMFCTKIYPLMQSHRIYTISKLF